MNVDAVSFDVGGVMAPTLTMADASGLAPLVLPESFLERHDTPQPSFDAIRRFETAMADVDPRAAAQVLRASLAVADTPRQIVQDGNTMAMAADKSGSVVVDKSVGQQQNPVAASCDPPVRGQDTMRGRDIPVNGQNTFRDAGGTQFIASESKVCAQLPSTITTVDKPAAVVVDKPVVVVV